MNEAKKNQCTSFQRLLAIVAFVLTVGSVFTFAPPSVSAASAPNIVMYQGRLLNSSRVPLSDTDADMIFEFYTAASGGSCLWSNSSSTCVSATARSVTLTDGLFSEPLGDTTESYAAIPDTVFGDNAAVYLQVTVEGEVLTPRKQLFAAPYAINSDTLDGLDADTDGATASAIAAYNSSGNLVVTGDPSSSGVGGGSLYVNPASVSANETLFGVANNGTTAFRVDAEGDISFTGDLSISSGNITSGGASGSVSIFDDTGGYSFIMIGGVNADLANTILIGINGVTADTIQIGNINEDTAVTLYGGDITIGDTNGTTETEIYGGFNWGVTGAGVGTFTDLACTDCLDFTELSDTPSLDASTALTFASSNLSYNLTSTGDFIIQDSGTAYATFSDTATFDFTNGQATAASVFSVTRNNQGSTFTGNLVDIQQNYATLASGTAVKITQQGLGNANGLWIVQSTVGDAPTTSPTSHALLIDVNESANNDDVILVRADADGTPDVTFRVDNNGTVTADDAFTGGGADYAEYFPTADTSLVDHVLACQDPNKYGYAKTCAPGDGKVFGVISADPAFIGNGIDADRDLSEDDDYRIVGLMGQIEAYATAAEGAIAVGDPLTVSSTLAGYAGKAEGASYIIGRAMEPLTSGSGTIRVLVQPMWYGGDILTMDGDVTTVAGNLRLASLGTATSDHQLYDSAGLTLAGSSWSSGVAEERAMTLVNHVSGSDAYGLAIQNNERMDVVSFSSTGDLALSGKLFPSDRGSMQYGAYLYYDSTGPGYMRTNAAGWATGSYDFAEMFASSEALVAGEVVELGGGTEQVVRANGPYSPRIAGIVSTRPGFLAGEQRAGSYPIALAGRVPTKVTAENGAIAAGDPLTTSSMAGYAMKATQAGPIVGYAMEDLSQGEGVIIVFVRPSYYDGGTIEGAPAANNVLSGVQNVTVLNVTGALNMNAGQVIGVGSITGIGGWEIAEDGDIVTRGQVTQLVRSLQNEDISTYAVTARETYVELSGTAQLQNGTAAVRFEDIDSKFNDIIDPVRDYRVFVTPNGVTGQVYAGERTAEGFTIHDVSGTTGVKVDWLVLAYRHDVAPLTSSDQTVPTEENAPVTEDSVLAKEEIVESVEDEKSEENQVSEEGTGEVEINEEASVEEGAVVQDEDHSASIEPASEPEDDTLSQPFVTESL